MSVNMKENLHQLGSVMKADASAAMSDLCTDVDQCVQRRLADSTYEFYFSRVSWQFQDGRLTLRGRVPTFYLKQMLQTILRDIEHVEHVVNKVDVVCATGLSSIRVG